MDGEGGEETSTKQASQHRFTLHYTTLHCRDDEICAGRVSQWGELGVLRSFEEEWGFPNLGGHLLRTGSPLRPATVATLAAGGWFRVNHSCAGVCSDSQRMERQCAIGVLEYSIHHTVALNQAFPVEHIGDDVHVEM